MSLRVKAIGLAAVAAIVTFVLGPVIWPTPPNSPMPPGAILPLFIALSAIESLAFGAGVAFLAFGYPYVRRRLPSAGQATAAYLALGWFLVNWWPHDNLHRVNGMNWNGLLGIEYGFHFTLIASAIALAWVFFGAALSGVRTSEA